MIAIIDYDAGNLKSVQKALNYIGKESIITREAKEILTADKIILPGVGAFGVAMEQLRKYQLDKIIKEAVEKNISLLGICLGQQLMFRGSEENGGIEGLGLLEGDIIKIPNMEELKIPHVGWNSLEIKNQGKLFQGILQGTYVYFVHSYYLRAKEENIVKAKTEYGVSIHASIEKENLYGCQFHPEKSGEIGLEILKNFIA